MGLKIAGWLMCIVGCILFLLMLPGLVAGNLMKPHGGEVFGRLFLFALLNAVLGYGLLKTKKWGIYGAAIFGIAAMLWFGKDARWGIGAAPFSILGFVFFLIIVIVVIPLAIKGFFPKK